MNENLLAALDHISDDHLTEALRQKRRKHYFLRAAAAVLAILFLLNPSPLTMPSNALALAAEYDPAPRPQEKDYLTEDAYRAAVLSWQDQIAVREQTAQTLNSDLLPFYQKTNQVFLDSDENRVWSPVNAGLGLSMLAETASGETQSQLLDLLGADSAEDLRTRFQALWESVWLDTEWGKRTLAASVWVDEEVRVKREVLDTLSGSYYASVYREDLSTDEAEEAMANWIRDNTGGILGDGLSPAISEDTVMALLSTVWLEGYWIDEFSPSENTTGPFHAPNGDVECTYMHKDQTAMTYIRGEDHSAVALPIKWDATLWLILPVEGKTVSDVLSGGDYLNTITALEKAADDEYLVNLSLPKFDILCELDLRDGLEELGVTEIFREGCPDLSHTFLTSTPIFVDNIRQVTRVTIDEEGVTAGSYMEVVTYAGLPAPPEQIIDFTLDRPFLFALTENTGGILLFTGVVTNP